MHIHTRKPKNVLEHTHAHAQDYGYAEFVAGVDTALLGLQSISPCLAIGDPCPDAGLRTEVFSSPQPLAALGRRRAQGVEIEAEAGDPAAAVRALKAAPGRGGRIWLVGGSQLAAPLMEAGLVDEMVRARRGRARRRASAALWGARVPSSRRLPPEGRGSGARLVRWGLGGSRFGAARGPSNRTSGPDRSARGPPAASGRA